MADKILLWSDRATTETTKLIRYLLTEWGAEIAEEVEQLIEKATERIEKFPEQFPVIFKRKNIRRCVLSPQTSIYFKVTQKEIEIITVFDNRQNPRKRKL